MGVKTSCIVHTSFKNVNSLHKKWNFGLFSKEMKSEFLDIDRHVWVLLACMGACKHICALDIQKIHDFKLSIPTNKCIFSQIWMIFFFLYEPLVTTT